MKVLQINKFNYLKGGADSYFIELSKLLEKGGLSVAKFAMESKENMPSDWDDYFVSHVDVRSHKAVEQLRSAGRAIWSFEAAKKMDHLVCNFKPEIAHAHNIYHQLSPSILPVLTKHNIPIVMHLHDWKLLSPDYKMFSKGKIDTSAADAYWRSAANRSLKGSFTKSFLAAAEMYWHHKVLKVYEKNISLYVAPSEFAKKTFVEFGFKAEQIKIIKPFINAFNYRPNFRPGKYILFFGRLEPEKGVDLLIKAFARLRNKNYKLLIVGSGSEYYDLKKLVRMLNLKDRIEFVGPKHGEDLKRIISEAYLVVVPSVWLEIFGLVNLEAGVLGKPVLAADVGGIPEAIKNNQTGLLFKHGSVEDLATKLDWCLNSPKTMEEMGEEARNFVENNFRPKDHLHQIISLYNSVIEKNKYGQKNI